MNIRTLQWNIGGGRVRLPDADPVGEESYAHDDLAYVVGVIKSTEPDIVTLQEMHGSHGNMQASMIAQELGFAHVVYDVYADSHLVPGQSLGQAVISRYPVLHHDFVWFRNPNLSIVRPNGERWRMHDKGVTHCLLDIDGRTVEVETLHMPPFRKFGMEPLDSSWKELRDDYAHKLLTHADVALVQGDFNFDHPTVEELVPRLFAEGFHEEPQQTPTTPKGRTYDHVLYKGVSVLSQHVVTDVLTDHFPVVTEFRV